jgi:hypothetical protein
MSSARSRLNPCVSRCRRCPGIIAFDLVIIIGASLLTVVSAVSQVSSHQTMLARKCETAKEATNRPGNALLTPDTVFHESNNSKVDHGEVPCLFRIKVPYTKPGDTVKLVGSTDSMGNWKTDKAITLKTSEIDFPWYDVSLYVIIPSTDPPTGGLRLWTCQHKLKWNTSFLSFGQINVLIGSPDRQSNSD